MGESLMTPEQMHQRDIERARIDIRTFCRLVLCDESTDRPFPQVAAVHRRWQGLANEHERLVLFKPSTSGATTQLIVGRTLHALGRDPTTRVLIAGRTQQAAARLVQRITWHIENSRELREIFPNLRRAEGQKSGTELSVVRRSTSKTPSVSAISWETTYGGGTLDLAFVHSICTPSNTDSDKDREKMLEWFHTSIDAKMKATGRVIYIGHPVHKEDLPNTLIDKENYASHTTRVRTGEGHPTIPEIWPEERIAPEEKKAEQTPALSAQWSRTMMCRLASEKPLVSLMAFVPLITPEVNGRKITEPHHLKLLVDMLLRCLTEQVDAIVSFPAQSGKSLTIMHALVWLMIKNPALRHMYLSYNAERGEDVSGEIMEIARRAGLTPTGTKRKWDIPGGGGLLASGVGGGVTGYAASGIVICDDLIKNWEQGCSPTIREAADNFLQSSVMTRRHPGSSLIVVATRWNEDDPTGRLEKAGWEVINVPAISYVDGKEVSYWPEGRPLEWLAKQKRDMRNPYIWPAMFMGQPRTHGQKLFEGPQHYTLDEVHPNARIAVGVDLAYSKKTSADTSVAVIMAEYNRIYYVLRVIRMQVKAPEFAKALKEIDDDYPGVRMRWYASTTEMGSADLIRDLSGVQIEGVLAKEDKFIRAGPVAVAWNQRRVKVPSGSETTPSIREFLSVVQNFTGLNDAHDDDADALAAAYDLLKETEADAPALAPPLGSPAWLAKEEERILEADDAAYDREHDREQEEERYFGRALSTHR